MSRQFDSWVSYSVNAACGGVSLSLGFASFQSLSDRRPFFCDSSHSPRALENNCWTTSLIKLTA